MLTPSSLCCFQCLDSPTAHLPLFNSHACDSWIWNYLSVVTVQCSSASMSGSTLPMCVLREVGMRDYQGLWVHNSLWSLYAGNAAKIRQCNHGLHCLQDTSWPETGHPLPSEIPRSSATFPWGCPIANLKTGHFVFWSSTDQNHIAGSFWIIQHIWALAMNFHQSPSNCANDDAVSVPVFISNDTNFYIWLKLLSY